MISSLLLATLLATLLAIFAGQVQAHSTAGRVKVDLDWAEPTVDDFAFFIESYVHRELYRRVYEQWEKRFYVKEFKGVELQPGGAVVRFATLDQKLRRDFADEMRFGRGEDGVWYHPAADGSQARVYSYIPQVAPLLPDLHSPRLGGRSGPRPVRPGADQSPAPAARPAFGRVAGGE